MQIGGMWIKSDNNKDEFDLSLYRLCLGFNYLTGNYYGSLWV